MYDKARIRVRIKFWSVRVKSRYVQLVRVLGYKTGYCILLRVLCKAPLLYEVSNVSVQPGAYEPMCVCIMECSLRLPSIYSSNNVRWSLLCPMI